MRRQTSIETYNKIKSSGLLSNRRFEVYDMLYHSGPMTANDLVRLQKEKNPNANQTGWNARFSELEKMGVIKAIGTKKDSISGNECVVWETTNELPAKLPKVDKKALKKQLVDKIASLGATVDDKLKVPLREIYKLANSI